MKKHTVLFAFVLLLSYCLSSAKDGKSSLSLQATCGIPTYTKYNEAAIGFGGNATLLFNIQESVFLTAHVGYMSFGTRFPEQYDNYNLQIIPILVGMRYHLKNDGIIPYIGLEAGMYMSHKKYQPIMLSSKSAGDFSTRDFGFAPTIGVLFPVGVLRVDIAAKYNAILYQPTEYLGINLGVIFSL